MLVSSFFFLKINYKTKKIYSSCPASKWQFPLALTELPLVNTSGRVQFSSPETDTFLHFKLHLNMANKSLECSVLIMKLLHWIGGKSQVHIALRNSKILSMLLTEQVH